MTRSDSAIANAPRNAIAVLGGSFDPVHLAHLWMAQAALEQLPVQQVLLIPTATSPLKPDGPVATNEQRLAMLRLAISGHRELAIDTWELEQNETSYTLKTLEHLRQENAERDIYLIIGADSLASFDRWHEPQQVLSLCQLSVVRRGGQAAPNYDILNSYVSPSQLAQIQANELRMPQIELSSSEIRRRIASGQSIRFRVVAPVAAFIHHERLYLPE